MKKEISHQDKLNFYKKFHSESFIKLYQSLEQRSAGYGFMLTRVVSMGAFVAGFFFPWFFLVFLSVETPIMINEINRHKKKKKLIESLVEGITYNDFVEMTENGEWQQLGMELSALEMPKLHYIEDSSSYTVADVEQKPETNLTEPSAEFIANVNEFVKIHNGSLLEYYTYDGFSETNETYITVRTHNGRILEFVVTPYDFVCIFEELNYSSQWQDFLESKKIISN